MKKKNLMILMPLFLAFGFIGCKNEVPPQETAPHKHTFSTEWEKDENYHWHSSTCEHVAEISEKSEHVWDNGKITKEPTFSAKGEKEYTCKTCGAKKTESLPKRTVQSELDDNKTVDLKNMKVSEKVNINKAVTLKNADFKGNSITVNASNGVLENIKNATIIITKEVGEGDFTIKSSQSITMTVEGGGKNSIHIIDTKIESIEIAKKAVRVVLEGKTEAQKVVVTEEKIKLESTGKDAKITTLEIGKDAKKIEVSGGKIETLKVTFAEGETNKSVVSVTNGASIEKAEAITESGDVAQNVTITVEASEDTKLPENVQCEELKDDEQNKDDEPNNDDEQNEGKSNITLTLVSGNLTISANDTIFTAVIDEAENLEFNWYFNNAELPTHSAECDISSYVTNLSSGYYDLIVTTEKDGVTWLSTYKVTIE